MTSANEPMFLSSTFDLIISIVLALGGLSINWKLLKDMNEDDRRRPLGTNECIIKHVLDTYTKVMMVLAPFYLLFFWFLNQDYDLPTWLQYSLCYDQYISVTFRTYITFHSMVIATMRYTFIVHRERVMAYEREKIKKMFYYGSIIIPVLMGLINACSFQQPKHIHNLAQSKCVEYYLKTLNITALDSNSVSDFGSPILTFVHIYIPTEITNIVKRVLIFLVITIMSNVVDGVLYWKIFKVIRQ